LARSPLRWLGGKSGIVKRIIPLFPPHDRYCEPFGGSAAVLLAKPRSKVEVYADLDKRLVNFFRVIQDPELLAEFTFQVMATPYSREARYRARKEPPSKDPVTEAVRLFVLSRQSFGGMVDKTSWGFSSTTGTSLTHQWITTIKRLPEVHQRLHKVAILRQPWETTVDMADRRGTLIYLDPPYVPDTRRDGVYQNEMSLEDHQRMVERLLRLKASCVLSGYPHEVYTPLEKAGWRKRSFSVTCMVVARTKVSGLKGSGSLDEQKRTECCWIRPA